MPHIMIKAEFRLLHGKKVMGSDSFTYGEKAPYALWQLAYSLVRSLVDVWLAVTSDGPDEIKAEMAKLVHAIEGSTIKEEKQEG